MLPELAQDDPLRGNPRSKLPEPDDVADLAAPPPRISPGADIGHVNIKVTDTERSLAFYRDAIGFRVTQRDDASVFLAAGDYHHQVALNIWGAPATEPVADAAGLHHFAIRLADAAALAHVVVRVLRAGRPPLGATDHGGNIAVYLRDPDGNGVELVVDRPQQEWPCGPEGEIAMRVDPLDLRALVAEALPTGPGHRRATRPLATDRHEVGCND